MSSFIFFYFFFFFNDTATTEIYTLSLHDALPICAGDLVGHPEGNPFADQPFRDVGGQRRSEEHTSELQSRQYLVCSLLLEKKKKNKKRIVTEKKKTKKKKT